MEEVEVPSVVEDLSVAVEAVKLYMKKINLYLIILLFIILVPISTFAKNDIYTKDAKIYITKEGTAQVTETWDVKGEDGTEWYIPLTNLGESEISNFTVQMDNKPLKFKNWDIDESLNEKDYINCYDAFNNLLCDSLQYEQK